MREGAMLIMVDKKLRDRHVFLFQHAIYVCKTVKSKYALEKTYNMSQLSTNNNAKGELAL